MLASHYVHSFFKRQLLVVPNIKLGAAWTDRDENDLKANFLLKLVEMASRSRFVAMQMHPLTLAVVVRPLPVLHGV